MTIKYDGFVGRKFPSLNHLVDALKQLRDYLMSDDSFSLADIAQRIVDGIREDPDQYQHYYDSKEQSFRLPNFVGFPLFCEAWEKFCNEHTDTIITKQ